MKFLERLSCVMGKQYIFKQSKNNYYNKYICKNQTKKEVQEWLIEQWKESESIIEKNLKI